MSDENAGPSDSTVKSIQGGLYARFGKRLLDVAVSLFALMFLAPALLLIAAAIRITMGKPVLFKQVRPGRNERLFTVIKFRTMTAPIPDSQGDIPPDEQRLTPTGQILRKTSLDELPQLVNVLRGEMSIIGPRPLAVKYLAHYTPQERARHRVRPGITGLAQVHGRNCLAWEERFAYDLAYVDCITFSGDMRILRMTIKSVFDGAGIQLRGTGSIQDFDQYRRSANANTLGPLDGPDDSAPGAYGEEGGYVPN